MTSFTDTIERNQLRRRLRANRLAHSEKMLLAEALQEWRTRLWARGLVPDYTALGCLTRRHITEYQELYQELAQP